MPNNLKDELREFLKNSNLSNYEINAYLVLIRSNELTARQISERSKVPTGRIYEVLDVLNDFGMIEIQDSRPKKFKAISFNQAFQNVISKMEKENQRRISYLYNQAKDLESKIYNSDFYIKRESSKVFWSTAFGAENMLSLYTKKFNNLKENLLMTGFLNDNTLKVIPFAKNFYRAILNAVNRGVQTRYLWSFEYDERPLTNEEKLKNHSLFDKLIEVLYNLFGLTPKIDGFEMRFIYRKIPTYYDIFDNSRVLIKLQNPLNPTQIFACMNVLDPILAKELANKYNNIWLFEATEKD
ncbi:MAG: TrmB family transcriptional regulator [Promethearchaeota archaeon]